MRKLVLRPSPIARVMRLGACALLITVTLGMGFAFGRWDGARSTESLDYREALRVMTDGSAPLERRHAAAYNVYKLNLEAARAFVSIDGAVDTYAGESAGWRANVVDEWRR